MKICNMCGQIWDEEDSENCPNCGSWSVRKDNEDNT